MTEIEKFFETQRWMPTWVIVALAVLAVVSIPIGLAAISKRAEVRAERRLAGQDPNAAQTRRERRHDRMLVATALIPTIFVWLAVMGVSFVGLTGFAKHTMKWDHWSNMLVPLSLDGISIAFGAWAFVAVKRGRHPGRSGKIVRWGALVSAAINLWHGAEAWALMAGLYLGFLSIAGMFMFHELLDQFIQEKVDEKTLKRVKATKPQFGERWFWAPLSSLLARRAWIVHPPQAGLEATAENALKHLAAVRLARVEAKATARNAPKIAELQAQAALRKAEQDVADTEAGLRSASAQQPSPVSSPADRLAAQAQLAAASAPVFEETAAAVHVDPTAGDGAWHGQVVEEFFGTPTVERTGTPVPAGTFRDVEPSYHPVRPQYATRVPAAQTPDVPAREDRTGTRNGTPVSAAQAPRTAVVTATVPPARTAPAPWGSGWKSSVDQPATSQTPQPRVDAHRPGTAQDGADRDGTPATGTAQDGADRDGTPQDGPLDNVRDLHSTASPLKDLAQLQQLRALYPGVTWQELRAAPKTGLTFGGRPLSKNRVSADVGIRKPRLDKLFYDAPGYAEQLLPDGTESAPDDASALADDRQPAAA